MISRTSRIGTGLLTLPFDGSARSLSTGPNVRVRRAATNPLGRRGDGGRLAVAVWEKLAYRGAMQLVSALDRDHLALRVRAEQGEIADQVEDLVTRRLVRVAKRCERPIRPEHDRVLERTALREAALDQRLDLVQEPEGPVRRDVADVALRDDLGFDVLRADRSRIVDGHPHT